MVRVSFMEFLLQVGLFARCGRSHFAGVVPGSGQQPQAKKAGKADVKNVVMQKKLARAQKLLEGLAIQDFDKITAAANELDELRKQAAWMVVRTKEYEVFSMDFGRHTADLQRAAKNKNVELADAPVSLVLNEVDLQRPNKPQMEGPKTAAEEAAMMRKLYQEMVLKKKLGADVEKNTPVQIKGLSRKSNETANA